MERTPIKVITPIEKMEVELQPYLIGKEKMKLTEMQDEDIVKNSKKILETVIVSANGNKETPIDEIENLHGKDFDFVMDKAVDVMNESSLEQKKNK